MFRAEEMMSLNGPIRLEGDATGRRLINDSELELRDAILIDAAGPAERHERLLGTIAAGSSVEIGSAVGQAPPSRVSAGGGPDPNAFLRALRATWWPREEDRGELRLVAWVPGPVGGQVIEPAVDRKRGFTAVIVHLRSGSPPSPDGRRYNLLAARDADLDALLTRERAAAKNRRLTPGSSRVGPTRLVPRPANPSIR
jgi:hypothetical protein